MQQMVCRKSDVSITDNGSNFTSEYFKNFLEQNGIRYSRTAPYHPASNGLAERAMQTSKERLKNIIEELWRRAFRDF